MKRWIHAATNTFKNFDNEDWSIYIAKKCKLSADEEDDILHDLNNLRADEVLELIENHLSTEAIEAFKEAFNLIEDEDED